ncbi:Glycosyl transferase family 2 [Flexibacter flexilis DSM 6793]|uniref:Glycosyl transferase family 2 n=1 Tax=Flexibacter flexilis DSM 6793 TaxID=927664 RepID=A0A1I1IGS6_9BACT|nr:glycosyltransferase [Flexibacter flexilis]SFC32963.1 Glycosyl transferase family 2 [Flexibacter flexilis DSM 6793]
MINSTLAPIVLFVYGRPAHTRQTLEALFQNDLAKESVLYIFADGAKPTASAEQLEKVRQTREVIREKQWCGQVHIVESETNKGLAQNIIEGVTRIVNQYGKVIVLEDDIVTSDAFLAYMNNALTLYQDNEKVMHVSGYTYPIKADSTPSSNFYFAKMMHCWGWATWSRAWKYYKKDAADISNKLLSRGQVREFDYDNSGYLYSQVQFNLTGQLNTWAIFWHAAIFLNNGLCLNPRQSFVQNIGTDSSGEHEGATDIYYHYDPLCREAKVEYLAPVEDKEMAQKIAYYYKYFTNLSLKEYKKRELIKKIKSIYASPLVFGILGPIVKGFKKIVK